MARFGTRDRVVLRALNAAVQRREGSAMKSTLSVLAATALLAAAAPSPATGPTLCLRPQAPAIAAAERGRTLTSADVENQRAAADRYFTSMDSFLDCTNREIERRMKAMFATNAPIDPGLNDLGAAHRAASEEKAAISERFVRVCLAWEDASGAPPPTRCAPTEQVAD
jgi:hypothetical protein